MLKIFPYFGTQFYNSDKALYVFSIEDIENVEMRRKEITVLPLSLYLQAIQQQIGFEQVVFLE